ncbi:hypothetical protein C8Q75DRAFT_723079 [Abortiporus biennis]|nr:hypothetical protein C8Q75DRAFT_723079 [Abortiporus biennis]
MLYDDPTAVPIRAESKEDSYPWTSVELPGRGVGVVATRDIKQGELLLREKPLFVVPKKVSASPGSFLLSTLAKLNRVERAEFYNLSMVNFPDGLVPDSEIFHQELALAIFQTNSIAAGENVGIFPKMARFNHGCSKAFNSMYTWREQEGGIVTYSIRDIKKGQELLTTYTDTKRPRNERRNYLKTMYGFDCQCSVCSLSDEASLASDRRLSEMSELRAKLSSWQNGELTGKQAVGIVNRIWHLGDEEGYWSERGSLAADGCWVAASHSDAEATKQFAKLAHKWYTIEVGGDSTQAKEMEPLISQPRRHHMWSKKKREFVGGPDVVL